MQIAQFLLAALASGSSFFVYGQEAGGSADKLVSDFKALTKSLNDLTATTKAFQGGIIASTGVASQSAKVSAAVSVMNADATALRKLDDSEADRVMTSVQAMEAPLDATLQAIVEKRSAFSAAFRPRIVRSLNQLVTATLNLGDTLKTKTNEGYGPKIDAETQKLDDKFKQAVRDFGA